MIVIERFWLAYILLLKFKALMIATPTNGLKDHLRLNWTFILSHLLLMVHSDLERPRILLSHEFLTKHLLLIQLKLTFILIQLLPLCQALFILEFHLQLINFNLLILGKLDDIGYLLLIWLKVLVFSRVCKMMTVLKNDTDTNYDDYENNTACNNFNNQIVFFGFFLIILIGRRGVYFIGAND